MGNAKIIPLTDEQIIAEVKKSIDDWRRGAYSDDDYDNMVYALEHIGFVVEERSL